MNADTRDQGRRRATSVRLGLAGAGLAVALAVTGATTLGGSSSSTTAVSSGTTTVSSHAVSAGS
jgi:hypothetical protein